MEFVLYFGHPVEYTLDILPAICTNMHARDLFPCGRATGMNKNVSPLGPEGLTFLMEQVCLPRGRRSCACAILSKLDKVLIVVDFFLSKINLDNLNIFGTILVFVNTMF